MTKIVLPFLCVMFCNKVLAQDTGAVTGKVTDKQTNESLPGATILIKGTSTSAVTDNEGIFIFRNISNGKIVLVISYVGYETVEKRVSVNDSNARVDVELSIDERVGNAIVVSASKRPEKITNAPASIQVIGSKELNEFAGSNVNELVSKIQGVEYTRNGVSDITFNTRGFHNAFNNKILLLVDGRISSAALSGNLPVMNGRGTMIKDDIERMEFALGPQSALYGPNALNAVVNTITRDPRKYQGTTASITAGNRYQYSGRIRQATKINNKWAYKLIGEYVAGKEFIFYDNVYLNPNAPSLSIPERNVNFDFRHIRGEASVYYSITTRTDLIVSTGGSNNYWTQVTTGGRNQLRGFNYSFIQARLVNPNYFVNIYNTWGNIGTSYPITPYTRDFWIRTHRPNNPATPEIAEDSAMQMFQFKEESQRLNADAQYNHEFKKAGLFFIGGLNYQKEKPNGFGRNLLDSFQRINITQYGAVFQLEKSLPWSMRFVGAVRWDNHSNFGNFFSPKLGLVKDFGNGSFRVTWGRAYAMPTILHQYSYFQKNIIGNGEAITYIPNDANVDDPKSVKTIEPLKPEQVSTWEFGYKGTIARKLFVDINYYNGLSKNFLGTPTPIGGRILYAGDVSVYSAFPGTVGPDRILKGASFFTYFNYSEVKAYGLDAGLTYSFNKFINLSIKYSWFDSDITDNDMKNDANRDNYVSLEETSLNAPNHRGLIMLNLQNLCHQKLFVNISARIVQQYDFYSGVQIGTEAGKGQRGKVYWGKTPGGQDRFYWKNFDWGPLGGFTTIDLSAGYKLNQMVQLNMGITNVLDTRQIEFVGSPSIGRLIVFELKVHVPNKKAQ